MKKIILFSFILFFLIMIIGLVSAVDFFGTDLQQGSELLVEWIQNIFAPIFVVLFGSSDYLFEKVLFFFVILAFSFVALRRFKPFEDRIAALWVVTLAVALLATRFLTETDFVQTILLSYTVLGVALTAGIPLIIFFFFVESFESGVLRKILWIFFIVVFLGIWGSRADELGQLSYIYLFIGVAALILLLADGTIRRAMINSRWKQLGFRTREEFARKLRDQMYDLDQDYTVKYTIDKIYWEREKRRLQKQLKQVLKN